ncbi:glycosyltransferase family 2 protein [Phycicoccus sp. CSK15P-2]|uniref:glycosyltransferase family 2 protein n=1 Tax=Phycicoccus sp. CSK15P-2 TaxID=2807627 RepID=UPI00195013FF|nr:glycosyltransferase family A protein [Phycicoccus sp. CSK15P-2]MBM6403007.1 glycosyltransferase family 2 protein [Phycicoccus sp. CSK15P-2]
MPVRTLWVVVPAFDEEARLPDTLAALAAQTDRDLHLVVVDNGSRDRTGEVARAFAATAPFPVTVLDEPEKGVGCAVDTGVRHAMGHGARHVARTDADCLPRPDWAARARAALDDGAELVCGGIVARQDENGRLRRLAFAGMVRLAATFGRWRPANRGREYRTPYTMHAGNNMAMTTDLYQRCGGMPRRPSPTDRTFLNRVRRVTDRVVQCPGMVSENSTRRITAYGVVGTARWYLDRGPGALTPDPR